MTNADTQQIVMIGLDSADVDYVQAHLHALPRLRQLADQGSFCRLSSPGSAMSAAVWPTFYTGRDPGEHGFYFPMQFHAESMRLRRVTDDWLPCKTFWNRLSAQGIPVTTFDVQTHFPSGGSNSVEISNWGAQSYSKPLTNRPDLLEAIHQRFGKHPMRHDVPQTKTDSQRMAIKDATSAGVGVKKDIALWLMQETDWRLFITVFTECHRAGHYLWPTNSDASTTNEDLLDIYRTLDSAIGDIVDRIDLQKTTVIIFSLHGMGPNSTQMHFMPQIMDRINVAFDKPSGDRVTFEQKPSRRHLMRFLRESLPPSLQNKIAEYAPESVRDWVVSRQFGGGLNWSQTPGFALPTGGEGFIRLNVKGRERNGILEVGSERYLRYKDWVTRSFLSLRDRRTGEPVVEDIYDVPVCYPGERVDRLPDLIVTWRDIPPATTLVSDVLGTMNAEFQAGRTGLHRPDGFAVICGNVPESATNCPLSDIKDFSTFIESALTGARERVLV